MNHKIKEIKLANGVEGLLIDVPGATVMNMTLNFRAGDFLSPKGKWEVAHILEHMVMGASEGFETSRQFRAEFDKNGAYHNASTSPYDLNYMMECADFEWERMLSLTKSALETAKLTDKEFKSELGNVREELVGDLNHNFRQIIIKSRQKFGLVALSDSERIKQLENISADDIRDYYKRTHVSDNLRFVIAGNVFERQEHIEELFTSLKLPRGTREEVPDETPIKYDNVFYLDKPDLENVYYFFDTFSKDTLTQREADALSMVQVMTTATLHSTIFGEARERGLAYHISSGIARLKTTGSWWFGAELLPQNALPVFDIMTEEITKLLQGKLDDKDLKAAQQYSLGRYQRGSQTVAGIANGYGDRYFFDGVIEDFYAVPDRIKAVTKKDVFDIVQKMIVDDTWGLTIMGTNKDELAKELNHKLSVLWQ